MANLETRLKNFAAGDSAQGGNLHSQLMALGRKAGYTDSYFKKKAEEESSIQQVAQIKQDQKKDNSGSNIAKVGRVGKSLLDSATSAVRVVGGGVGELTNVITGGAEKQQKAYDVAQSDSQKALINAIQQSKNTSLPDKQREQWAKVVDSVNQSIKEQYTSNDKVINDRRKRLDPVKNAAAIGEIGLDILTAGTGSLAITGTKTALKSAAKATSKEVAKDILQKEATQLLKRSAVGATQGAASGGLYAVETNGSQVKAGEILKQAGVGGLVGSALPLAGAGITKINGSAPVKSLEKAIVGKVAETKLGSSVIKTVGDVTEKVNQALVNTLAPVTRDFKGLIDKTTGRQVNEEVRTLQGNVVNSAAIAAGRRKENEAYQQIAGLLSPEATRPGSRKVARKETEELGKFISAKQDAVNTQKLGKKNVEIPVGTPKEEKAYSLLNQSTKGEIQYAYDGGLITKANYHKYMADDNYTRVQRDMSEEIQRNFKGAGGPDASISSHPLQQRLKGAGGKDAINPFVAYVDWSDLVTKAVERKKLSSYIIDQRQAHNLGKGFLRKADDVEARLAARGEAAQIRVLRDNLSRFVKTESRYSKRLQSELDNLNKQGLNVALKKGGKETLPNFNVEGIAKNLKTRDTKSFIKSLVDAPISDLEAIKRKIANREPKLAASIDNIIGLKKQHEVAAKAVREANDIARANADKIATGKNTIKTFRRGIKEVWEDEPRIVDAINRVGKVEMHALLKLAQTPSRIIQRAATGLNFAFGLKNYGRDQLSSAILSKNIRATHNPISFMMGLKEAALKPTGKALLRGVGLRETSKKVLNPTKEYEVFLKHVAGQTQVSLSQSVKKTARKTYEELGLKGESLLRKTENANSATENATRFQNFYGIFKNAMKKGDDYETALNKAIQAGRENSVDFSQSGDWAPFLKIMNPFVNANIQGSRSLIRAFKERPIGTSLKVGAVLYTPVALSTYYNLSDPQRALVYSALPESTKSKNLIFITESGNVVKLPLPPGMGELAQPVRRLIEAEYGFGDKETFTKTAKSLFVDSVNPFNKSDLAPQFSKPAIENITNHNFFTDKSIVPDNLKDKPINEQVSQGTGQTYRDIGSITNTSPLKVKNLVKGYGGPLTEQFISYFDKGRRSLNSNVVAEDRTTTDQLQKGFYEQKPDLQKKADSLFYEKYNKISSNRQSVAKEIKTLRENNKFNESNRKAQEYNQTLQSQFSGIEKYGWNKDWDKKLHELIIKPMYK